jgi:hypothetical protein
MTDSKVAPMSLTAAQADLVIVPRRTSNAQMRVTVEGADGASVVSVANFVQHALSNWLVTCPQMRKLRVARGDGELREAPRAEVALVDEFLENILARPVMWGSNQEVELQVLLLLQLRGLMTGQPSANASGIPPLTCAFHDFIHQRLGKHTCATLSGQLAVLGREGEVFVLLREFVQEQQRSTPPGRRLPHAPDLRALVDAYGAAEVRLSDANYYNGDPGDVAERARDEARDALLAAIPAGKEES